MTESYELTQHPAPNLPFAQKPLELLDLAANLYGFIPEDDDERWKFLQKYSDVKSATNFSKLNFTNAWGATYLSSKRSYRRGYITSVNAENNLQLERALDNVAEIPLVYRKIGSFAANNSNDETGYNYEFSVTDRINSGGTESKQNITPCPEALYQLRLFREGKYLARTGFNLHSSGEKEHQGAISIANIQGVPGAIHEYRLFEKTHGISPFNALVRKVVEFAEDAYPEYELRGLINPKKGNSQLYWCALEYAGIPKYYAHHKNTP